MTKFEIRDRGTGKAESYTKEGVTMGKAEKCHEYLELVSQENKKEALNAAKMRQKEWQLLVDLLKGEGSTEGDVLNKMGIKTYTEALQDVLWEINGEDEEDSETEPEGMGRTEERSQ